MNKFSIVLPVKDELQLFKRTFPYVLNLGAEEILVCLDYPPTQVSTEIKRHLVQTNMNHPRSEIHIIEVPRNSSWGFHQGHVRRVGYEQAKYDIIFTLDVDVVVRRNVLKGLDHIGKDNLALVSFNKLLNLSTPPRFIRSVSHALRSQFRGSRGFTGLYWLYRPWYYELIPVETLKKISNGEDTLLIYQLNHQTKYRRFHFKEVGAYCLTPANEDLPWRQFEHGVWMAMMYHPKKGRILDEQKKTFVLASKLLMRSLLTGYPHTLRGFLWARRNHVKTPNDYYDYQMHEGPKWKQRLIK